MAFHYKKTPERKGNFIFTNSLFFLRVREAARQKAACLQAAGKDKDAKVLVGDLEINHELTSPWNSEFFTAAKESRRESAISQFTAAIVLVAATKN